MYKLKSENYDKHSVRKTSGIPKIVLVVHINMAHCSIDQQP